MEVMGFSQKQADEIKGALKAFRDRTGAMAVAIVHVSGHVVFYSLSDSFPVEAISALMAGIFAAVREFFRLSGFKDVASLLVEGEDASVYSVVLNSQFFIFVVFNPQDVRMGMLKLALSRVKKEVSELIDETSISKSVDSFLSTKPSGEVIERATPAAERPPGTSVDELVRLLKREIERELNQ